MRHKTRDVPALAARSVAAALGDLGSIVIRQEPTPGAVGYIRLTYTVPPLHTASIA